MLGAVATILLRESSDDSAAADPVRASSVVSLLGSLFLRDPTAVLAFYGGSFVGMSLPSRLMHGDVVAPRSNARSVVRPQGPLSLLGSFASGTGTGGGAVRPDCARSLDVGFIEGSGMPSTFSGIREGENASRHCLL
jgi:hypothetical protein